MSCHNNNKKHDDVHRNKSMLVFMNGSSVSCTDYNVSSLWCMVWITIMSSYDDKKMMYMLRM